MSLPPVAPERNREILAERLGWPDGALEACRELEQRHPGWSLWYDIGGLPASPVPRYRAECDYGWRYREMGRPRQKEEVCAAAAEEVSALIAETERRT
ncbi:hypothetical protein [Actinomadura sp. 21ATH]|uniref:hypothetical protein n=1 Tax=Actinomadura sp. 21ATH TaxID=1735444 RepID=UPI0035C18525